MHILVAALLALSCFIPVFGSLSSGDAGHGDTAIQNERTIPDFDDQNGDSTFDGDRVRPDLPDANQSGQDGQNGTSDQKSPDADGQTDDQNAPDGTTQNGDRSGAKRFNRAPDGQSGTATPEEGATPDDAAKPDAGEITPNNATPTV